MNRRIFLRHLLLGGATAALLPGRVFAGSRQPAAEAAPTQRWAQLLDYARWAPSPHNVQPWKLQVLSATEAALYYDPTRLLVHTDPTSAFTIIGLGMFIECLRIAAGPLGFALHADHAPEPRLNYSTTVPQFFATLRLTPQAPTGVADRELIKQRRTSRLHYDGRSLAPALQAQLAATAAQYGHRLEFSAESETVDFVLDLNRATLFTDLDEPATRQELARWIRTTPAEAATRKDGLWNQCFGFPGRLMHNFFFHSERFQSAWKRKILGRVYRSSTNGTAQVAWLTGRFDTRTDWLQAGAMLQRLWLELTRHGAYLHPFGSVVTNAQAHAAFVQHTNLDPADGPLWLLVRTGYSAEPPRSFRLDVHDILQ
ncbi:hypothetical protein F0P96_00200 [Hymenobacter busanensis]|uniref:Uncharacterized protein n=1 Tax=Hymenobacter busanensis TaxID=2607656 RepID=A0A7L4ZUN8_9BACT|nr:hypothetical protein [Hymenobacter busanensis]KAA9339094.1 hypothetical protein F0P96_00200 [Hymenobacter busanensis]QHJ07144.1 hypothetical protein GUY19_07550 [Hymenobacter busanensis]